MAKAERPITEGLPPRLTTSEFFANLDPQDAENTRKLIQILKLLPVFKGNEVGIFAIGSSALPESLRDHTPEDIDLRVVIDRKLSHEDLLDIASQLDFVAQASKHFGTPLGQLSTNDNNDHSLEIGDICVRIEPPAGKPIEVFFPVVNPYYDAQATIDEFINGREADWRELTTQTTTPQKRSTLIHFAYVVSLADSSQV